MMCSDVETVDQGQQHLVGRRREGRRFGLQWGRIEVPRAIHPLGRSVVEECGLVRARCCRAGAHGGRVRVRGRLVRRVLDN